VVWCPRPRVRPVSPRVDLVGGGEVNVAFVNAGGEVGGGGDDQLGSTDTGIVKAGQAGGFDARVCRSVRS